MEENLPPPPPGGPPGMSAEKGGPPDQPGSSSVSPPNVSGGNVAGGSVPRPGLPRAAPSGQAGPSKPGSVAPKFKQITRNGQFGSKGQPVQLIANHYKVEFKPRDDVFHYNVTIDPGTPTAKFPKVLSRKIMAKLYDTFGQEKLNGKRFAYDGEKSLFTVGPLMSVKSQDFHVLLDDEPGRGRRGGNYSGALEDEEGGRPSQRRRVGGRDFDVEIKLVAQVNMTAIQEVLSGKGDDAAAKASQDGLRVLDIMLREHAAKRDYLLIRDNFFHNTIGKVGEIGEGVQAWSGFHCSFRPTSGGCLTLNFDLSTTTVIKPSPVLAFIAEYCKKDIRSFRESDWQKVKRVLKGIQVETYAGRKQKVTGLSQLGCDKTTFEKKIRGPNGEPSGSEVTTVARYFQHERNMPLMHPHLPALDLGRAKKPNFVPIEFCKIPAGQRYKRSLTSNQRKNHIDCSRQEPHERKLLCQKGMEKNDYNSDDLVREFNVQIETNMVRVKGRILDPPALMFGNNREERPRDGRWNYNSKKVKLSCKIGKWAVANFGRNQHAAAIAGQLQNVCGQKGMQLETAQVFEEDRHMSNRAPEDRVKDLISKMRSYRPDFILVILPDKSSELYGPLKKYCETTIGVISQCIVPPRNVKDQYLTNVALKINLKCEGYNTLLGPEEKKQLPKVSQVPTCIFGLDVSHGSPGDATSPSIAAAVASMNWPNFSKYTTRVRAQAPKTEMIEGLYEEIGGKRGGMVMELLTQFFATCYGSNAEARKPRQIVIYRDGVSESQFQQVLDTELFAFKKALRALETNPTSTYNPKVTFIVVQKRHHTRFFPVSGQGNILPGTVVDTDVCHPKDNDFFLCSHKGLIGTSRPTHYHVLYDEIGFTADELQNLTHCLCYSYARCTTAVSVAAPAYYAHLAAQHCRNFVRDDGSGSESSSMTTGRPGPVTPLPPLSKGVLNKMFYT